MDNRRQTLEYDLAAVVENQTPEQRGAVADAIVGVLREMTGATAEDVVIYFTGRPANCSPMQGIGKSRLTSAIKQAIT